MCFWSQHKEINHWGKLLSAHGGRLIIAKHIWFNAEQLTSWKGHGRWMDTWILQWMACEKNRDRHTYWRYFFRSNLQYNTTWLSLWHSLFLYCLLPPSLMCRNSILWYIVHGESIIYIYIDIYIINDQGHCDRSLTLLSTKCRMVALRFIHRAL